jgi:hypothetical protein
VNAVALIENVAAAIHVDNITASNDVKFEGGQVGQAFKRKAARN